MQALGADNSTWSHMTQINAGISLHTSSQLYTGFYLLHKIWSSLSFIHHVPQVGIWFNMAVPSGVNVHVDHGKCSWDIFTEGHLSITNIYRPVLTGRHDSRGREEEKMEERKSILILKLSRVVVEQNVPALDLLVFVLQALVPVLQTLSFSLDAQLTASCRERQADRDTETETHRDRETEHQCGRLHHMVTNRPADSPMKSLDLPMS